MPSSECLPIFLLQIQTPKGKVLITNDGATILKQMEVIHPTARMVSLYSPSKPDP